MVVVFYALCIYITDIGRSVGDRDLPIDDDLMSIYTDYVYYDNNDCKAERLSRHWYDATISREFILDTDGWKQD